MQHNVASAILQVDQEVEEGWPNELVMPGGEVIEVYMQPCQMLLYEGSRIPHGRPMRFRGKRFVMAFVHFTPKMWTFSGGAPEDEGENAVTQ